MAEKLSFGKNGKYGEIDFSKIRSGIRKQDLLSGISDNKLKSIFEQIIKKIDVNPKDNMLSREELQLFYNELENLSKQDGNLSNKEARKYEINGESIGRKGQKALFAFLNKLEELSQDVANISYENVNGQKVEVIEYKNLQNKKQENIFSDGSKIINIKSGEKSISTRKNKEDKTIEESVTKDDETVTTYFAEDGKTKTKEVQTNNKTHTSTTLIYENSTPSKRIVEKDNTKETYIIQKIDNKDVWQIQEKTEIKDGVQHKTVYDYDKQGNKFSETETSPNKTIDRSFEPNGHVLELIKTKGEPDHIREYDTAGNYTDMYMDGEAKIIDSYDSQKELTNQQRSVKGKLYQVNYDKNGNTDGIIVQNGESIKQIANKFGVSERDLVRVNASKLHGKYPKAYFYVGDEIKIPRKLKAGEEVLQGRQTREEAIAEFRADQERATARREAQEARESGLEREQEMQYKDLGLINHQGAGKKIIGDYWKNNKKVKSQEFTIIGQCINGRTLARSKSGELVVIAHNGVILKTDYVKNTKKYEAIKQYNKQVKIRKNAESLAKEFYHIADENSGFNSMKKMQKLLDENINSSNILAFLDAYDKETIKRNDSSIIDTVTSEIGAGGSKQQKKVLLTIFNKLCEAAKKAGVSSGDIQKAKNDFITSLEKEFSAIRRTNPKDMEKALDFLRGAIAVKQTANISGKSTADAINSFNASYKQEYHDAQSAYNTSKGKDGWSWSAQAGDTVCGWFGCNTIEDIERKLGANAKYIKELASSKTESEFKSKYKKIFGIEFDSQKIAAVEAAQVNYSIALGLSKTIKTLKTLLTKGNKQSLSQYEQSVKMSLNLDDQTFESFKSEVYSSCKNDSEKKQALVETIESSVVDLNAEYGRLTKGKSLDQMGKDIQLITRSTFGTSDIGKDVSQFASNMATTEMITDIAGDIALTVVISLIPGGAALGAAKIAATTAKWGSKGLKIAKVLNKTAKAMEKVQKFQQGKTFVANTNKGKYIAKTGNLASRAISGGAAAYSGTYIYESAATHHSSEEILEKCKTNGIYGVIGGGSSAIAPKLMQVFKINSPLATEISEEIINALGAAGVELSKGSDYGSSQAAIDIISGILIARLSHVGHGTKAPTSKTSIETPVEAQILKTPTENSVETQIKASTETPEVNEVHTNKTASIPDYRPQSSIIAGEKKIKQASEQVEKIVNKSDVQGEELANVRNEQERFSNRDIRRSNERLIDERAKQLSEQERVVYEQKNAENLQKDVSHIFAKHSYLNDSDVRVLTEYINKTKDIDVLNNLKENLKNKEYSYGGVTANYRKLNSIIDSRIRALTPKQKISGEDVKNYIYSKLNSDKGLVKEEVEQILDYIKNISSSEELREITTLVGKKKMIGAYKNKLQNAINERSNNLKTAGSEPKAEETPEVNEVRLENTVKNEEPTILNQKEIEKEPIIEKEDRIKGNSGKESSINKASEQVEKIVNKPDVQGEELANVRNEQERFSNRDIRRSNERLIDERAKQLSEQERVVYEQKNAENLQKDVSHIFAKHSYLNDSDVRILSEYINKAEDIDVLNNLKENLKNKEYSYGGVTANYRKLDNIIDSRIRTLTPKQKLSDKEVKNYIYSKLNSDKGLVKEEVEQLLDYIKNISSSEELKEISSLVGKKRMIGAYKKKLQNAINERF